MKHVFFRRHDLSFFFFDSFYLQGVLFEGRHTLVEVPTILLTRVSPFTKLPRMSVAKRQKLAPVFERASRKKEKKEEDVMSSPREYKMVTWNVAGARAWSKKKGHESIVEEDADLIFLNETKCLELPAELTDAFPDHHSILYPATVKKGGYAGVALLSRIKPLKVTKGIGDEEFDAEGLVIIAEYSSFYFVEAYVPNSGRGLVNLPRRREWENLMRDKLKELDCTKPVVYSGDLNVAHEEIDLARPKENANKTAGFTDEEREDFTKLLGLGFVDTFRLQNFDNGIYYLDSRDLHPERVGYTFWSFMGNARAKNIGWRLDYFVVSERIAENVHESEMLPHVMGSDHCPIRLRITL